MGGQADADDVLVVVEVVDVPGGAFFQRRLLVGQAAGDEEVAIETVLTADARDQDVVELGHGLVLDGVLVELLFQV